jgi:uncharacterized YigZ family protein
LTDEAKDSFLTVKNPVVREFKEKGSRFIGHLHRTVNQEEAEALIEKYRKKYFDATHNCFAIYIDESYFRYSDDGEPSGSAGKPIYSVLEGSGLKQITCVVTRYYGGTKLGVGGLVRAYSAAARLCLEDAERKEIVIHRPLTVEYRYDDTSAVMRLIELYAGKVKDNQYGDTAKIRVEIRESKAEQFKADITEATKGRAKISDEIDD